MNISPLLYKHYCNELNNQAQLYNLLLEKDFEKDDNYVLSNSGFGIPITTMLLLLKDAKIRLIDKQNELYEISDENISVSFNDIKEMYSLTCKNKKVFELQKWRKYNSLELSHANENIAVSGSLAIVRNEILKPETDQLDPLYDNFETNKDNIEIRYDKIVVHKDKQTDFELIRFYQDFLIFSEFSYAIHQRINFEIKEFNRRFTKNIDNSLGNRKIYNGNISRRERLIHKGQIKFDMDHDNSIVISSKKYKLTDIVNKGFDECCEWVNTIYGNMFNELNK